MKFMDREELMAKLNGLSDAELLDLVTPDRGDDERPVRHTAAMPDGSVVTADSAEELNRLLTAKLAEYREREDTPEPRTPESTDTGVRKWDYKTFSDTFVADPRAGMEYLEEVQSGVKGGYSKLVPLLVNALGTLTSKVEELEAQDFLNTTPEYTPSVENRKVLDQIITERGWKVNSTSLSDAFDIASRRGLISSGRSTRQSEPAPFTPPRIRRSMSAEEPEVTIEQIQNAAEEMPIKDLQKLLIAGGVLKGEHV